jgi:rhomboid protease GluP
MIVLLLLLAAVVYFMTPDERTRAIREVRRGIQRAHAFVSRVRNEEDPYADTLRGRTPHAFVTLAFVIASVTLLVLMIVLGPRPVFAPDSLVSWGAEFGPRTTNGEWWRLVTALVVHAGVIHVLFDIVGMLQSGILVERLFGRLAAVGIYIGAGVVFNLITLATHPVGITTGAAGAIAGMYGTLLAWLAAGWVFGSPIRIPGATLRRLAPSVAIYLAYTMLGGTDRRAMLASLFVGLAYGLVLARNATERKPSFARTAVPAAVCVMLVALCARPLAGLVDIRPELARITEVEARTSAAYDEAVRKFRLGQNTIAALVQVIERNILADLQTTHSRLTGLRGVPQQHAPLVARANEFLSLREDSWRTRAEALKRNNHGRLREADRTERASLDALARLTGTSLED